MPPDPSERRSDPGPRPLRWLDPLTSLFVLAAIVIVGVTASPHVLRLTGAGRPPSIGFSPGSRFASNPNPAPAAQGLQFKQPDDPPELDRMFPQDPWHAPRPSRPRDDGQFESDGDGLAYGTLRRAIALHARAENRAEITGELPAGSLVLIAKESGDWAYVLFNGEANGKPGAGIVTGWVKKSEISVR
jgi:hypothetical protein